MEEEELRKEKRKRQQERFDALMSAVRDMRQDESLDGATIMDMLEGSNLIKPIVQIKYVEKPLKITPERQEYYRVWYEKQKEQKKIDDLKKLQEEKIKEAVRDRVGFCFRCQKTFEMKNNTHEIRESKKKGKRILVCNVCPYCDKEIKMYGGLLPQEI